MENDSKKIFIVYLTKVELDNFEIGKENPEFSIYGKPERFPKDGIKEMRKMLKGNLVVFYGPLKNTNGKYFGRTPKKDWNDGQDWFIEKLESYEITDGYHTASNQIWPHSKDSPYPHRFKFSKKPVLKDTEVPVTNFGNESIEQLWSATFSRKIREMPNPEEFDGELSYDTIRTYFDNGNYRDASKFVYSGPSERTRIARQRAGQRELRQHVLWNYESRCAMCDIQDKSLLEACHLIPWKTDAGNRFNLANVFCLCSFHHKLFDKGFISIGDDYEIIKTDKLRTAKSNVLTNLVKDTRKIRRPRKHPLDLDLIKRYNESPHHGIDCSN